HGSAALLAAHGYGNVAIIERIKYGEITFTRNAKNVPDAFDGKLIDEDLRGSFHLILGVRDVNVVRSPSERPPLNPKHGDFRVGEIANPRLIRATEVFGHLLVKVPSEDSCYGAVRVGDHNWPAAACKITPQRTRKINEVIDIAAVNEMNTRDGTLEAP